MDAVNPLKLSVYATVCGYLVDWKDDQTEVWKCV